ncbi:MAG TPA: agmatine deiminase family protein [Gemmatimonadales bacterium]|nr:agmatine deiminase family protein [Gemmatimonadales bacterium]
MTTPAQLGYRLPAEWEPHHATWLGWPHNRSDWPGKFAPIPWVYAEIVRKLVPGEVARILVPSPAQARQARGVLTRAGADLGQVEFIRCPTNRGWTRDFGPLFLRRTAPQPELAIARFRFNAWAKYPDWKQDDRVPERMAARFKLPLFPVRVGRRAVVLEGGSIDVNGRGTVLTTEECLLDPAVQVRNPGLSRTELEGVLRDSLGVTTVLWLGRGIVGDDTHGHVDDVCRFVNARTVVLCREHDPRDANYRALNENRERLEGMRLEDGSKLERCDLPMPAPLYYDGHRLPASYANFYIANQAVLVPTFNDPQDRVALGILAELISDRPVVGIHAVDLVWGLGTLHCLTQQEPRL